jgi:virulence factor
MIGASLNPLFYGLRDVPMNIMSCTESLREVLVGGVNLKDFGLKIGIIGLGDIAQKAYLPILIKKENMELVLCTRNIDTLNRLSKKYRMLQCVQTVDELIEKGIDAAFVSTATQAHFEVAEKFLGNGINVYVDKPISLSFDENAKLVRLAVV